MKPGSRISKGSKNKYWTLTRPTKMEILIPWPKLRTVLNPTISNLFNCYNVRNKVTKLPLNKLWMTSSMILKKWENTSSKIRENQRKSLTTKTMIGKVLRTILMESLSDRNLRLNGMMLQDFTRRNKHLNKLLLCHWDSLRFSLDPENPGKGSFFMVLQEREKHLLQRLVRIRWMTVHFLVLVAVTLWASM